MLAALRRRLFAIAWFIAIAQGLVVAAAAARMCAGGEHTHAGVVAPDCAMHHHDSAPVPGAGAVHRHAASHSADPTAAQISCRCSNEPPSIYVGDCGTIERVDASSPSALVVAPAHPADESCVARHVEPAFPPPR